MMNLQNCLCAAAVLLLAAFSAPLVAAMDDATCMTMQLESMNVYFLCYDEAMKSKKPKLGGKICRRTMVDYLRLLRRSTCAINERPKKIVKEAKLCATGNGNPEDAAALTGISTLAKCQSAIEQVLFGFGQSKNTTLPVDQEDDHTYIVSQNPPLYHHYICGDEEYTCTTSTITGGDCPPQACDDGTTPRLESGNERFLRRSRIGGAHR